MRFEECMYYWVSFLKNYSILDLKSLYEIYTLLREEGLNSLPILEKCASKHHIYETIEVLKLIFERDICYGIIFLKFNSFYNLKFKGNRCIL